MEVWDSFCKGSSLETPKDSLYSFCAPDEWTMPAAMHRCSEQWARWKH